MMTSMDQKSVNEPKQSSLVSDLVADGHAGAGEVLPSTLPDGDRSLSVLPSLIGETEMVKVRVLRACYLGQPNDVVELSATDAEQASKAGDVDSRGSAVAYAEKLQASAQSS